MTDAQFPEHVGKDYGRRLSGQSHQRGLGAEARRTVLGDAPKAEIGGPEFLPPLADTVALVDDDLTDVAAPQFPIGQGLAETRRPEALRCHQPQSGALRSEETTYDLHTLIRISPSFIRLTNKHI